MGLPHGCTKIADDFFITNKYKGKYNQQPESSYRMAFLFEDTQTGSIPCVVSPVYGDCTAATVYIGNHNIYTLKKLFTILQEYLSINGRISCFFSLKIQKVNLEKYIQILKQFPIAGLHLQKSNRNPEDTYYQLSGILKIPNPLINTYDTWNTQEYPKTHNNNDTTKLNEINSEFNLQTF